MADFGTCDLCSKPAARPAGPQTAAALGCKSTDWLCQSHIDEGKKR